MNYSKYFPILDYYDKVVGNIDKRFKYIKDGRRICPFHGDTDPSLGIPKGGSEDKMHCFGCNWWGNVVDMHIKVSRMYFNKMLSKDQALYELCQLFGVDYKKLPKDDGSKDSKDVENSYIRREMAIQEAMGKYTLADFKEDIMIGKMENKGIRYFNSLLVHILEEGD